MYVRRTRSEYGRFIPKPQAEGAELQEDQHEDITVPIQDQLEAITVKIHLRELYNRVLRDEFEQTESGASSILKELEAETVRLHNDLNNALNAEILAVRKALRSHREFQLAMTDKPPQIAIPWLDDKLHDISRRLDLYVNSFFDKRKKLEWAENLVNQIEKWPRPGTQPWEIEAVRSFHVLESRIEHMKVKLETATILRGKYSDIVTSLHDERGKYAPIISGLDDQCRMFAKELADLQKTLNDAISFRDLASRNMITTQKESTENRRRRRNQMTKMRAAVRKVMEASAKVASGRKRDSDENRGEHATGKTEAFEESMRFKRAAIEKFQDRAYRIVEAMRVPNLTHIPVRFQSVMSLGERLRLEIEVKEELLQSLLHQKSQLYILLAHFTYTGASAAKEFHAQAQEFKHGIEETNLETTKVEGELNEIGVAMIDIRSGALRMLESLHRKRAAYKFDPDVSSTLQLIGQKIQKLVERNAELKSELENREPTRNYGAYVKEPFIPSRLIRAGSAGSGGEESGDSDADDDVVDLKVPNRIEMKARSVRFIRHARLRKGLR